MFKPVHVLPVESPAIPCIQHMKEQRVGVYEDKACIFICSHTYWTTMRDLCTVDLLLPNQTLICNTARKGKQWDILLGYTIKAVATKTQLQLMEGILPPKCCSLPIHHKANAREIACTAAVAGDECFEIMVLGLAAAFRTLFMTRHQKPKGADEAPAFSWPKSHQVYYSGTAGPGVGPEGDWTFSVQDWFKSMSLSALPGVAYLERRFVLNLLCKLSVETFGPNLSMQTAWYAWMDNPKDGHERAVQHGLQVTTWPETHQATIHFLLDLIAG